MKYYYYLHNYLNHLANYVDYIQKNSVFYSYKYNAPPKKAINLKTFTFNFSPLK